MNDSVINKLLQKLQQYRANAETTAKDIALADGTIFSNKDATRNTVSLYGQLIAVTENYLSTLKASERA